MSESATDNSTVTSREYQPDLLKVLVVEDDESHVLALTIGLERENFAVTAVSDGRDAVSVALSLKPDVILLDVMLPGISGLDVCKELRLRGFTTPIIMVSARSEELDVVVGIEVGADDYVAKPYRIRELVARIGAIMRRRRIIAIDEGASPNGASEESDHVLRVGDVVLDAARHEVFVRSAQVQLPLREFQVLRELLEHPGKVISRDDLLNRIWGFDYDGDPRIVATIVGRLRARIERSPDEQVHISTIRGVGYRFNDRF
jgi:two-component system, OmpR family, response regulator RegX3